MRRKTRLKFGGPYTITKVHKNDSYTIPSLEGMKGYKKYKAVVPVDQTRKHSGGVLEQSESDSSINSTDELLDLLQG